MGEQVMVPGCGDGGCFIGVRESSNFRERKRWLEGSDGMKRCILHIRVFVTNGASLTLFTQQN